MRRRTTWIAAATAAVVLAGCALAWLLLRTSDDEAEPGAGPASTPSSSTARVTAPTVSPAPGPCDVPATEPFEPERISIDGIVDAAAVIGVARDSRGVTGVLPTSAKDDFAWDLGGIEPGSPRGHVLLNTHTWPNGSALGNALLEGLDEGDRLVLSGHDERLCYRVTRRIEVLAADGYAPYYATQGPPRVAIIVCSGQRIGPGQWTHRTIWFARPVTKGRMER